VPSVATSETSILSSLVPSVRIRPRRPKWVACRMAPAAARAGSSPNRQVDHDHSEPSSVDVLARYAPSLTDAHR
jgi:hypothetical protein